MLLSENIEVTWLSSGFSGVKSSEGGARRRGVTSLWNFVNWGLTGQVTTLCIGCVGPE